ncbi:hypothetical protein PG988_010386 [Apiospora saccharicola]
MLSEPTVSALGPDPSWRKHVLNGNAFQQDVIQSFNGWQYACFYSSRRLDLGDREPLYVHLSRRKLPIGQWETFVFHDHPQTTDDGHNTVQPRDGPRVVQLVTPILHPTLHHLPGLESSVPHDELLSYITYPRFGQLGDDLWFSFRTGKAGLGDDHLYLYSASRGAYSSFSPSSATGASTATTPFLKGIQNNPYIHGLDSRGGTLYVTWVYRDFVWYEGWDDPADTKHKQQAGPNSAANNRDLCYAYSSPTTTVAETGQEPTLLPAGQIWRNGAGDVIADLARGESITPSSPGVTAFRIPKGSGLTNQEAQAVDHGGGVHVLNRDSCPSSDPKSGGPDNDDKDGTIQEVKWKHYYRDPTTKTWTSRALPCGYVSGKRGRLAVSRDDDLYIVLPGGGSRLSIWRAAKSDAYSTYSLVWSSSTTTTQGEMFPLTEPLVDTYRLDHDNVLSVFTRRYAAERLTMPTGPDLKAEEYERKVDVVVLDFQL